MTEENRLPVEHPLAPRPEAVIVGASAGLGAALARELARKGYKLALLARRRDKLDELCEEINRTAGERRAVAYQHDVTDYAKVPALFQTILQEMQNIDVLIYNAGTLYTVGLSDFGFDKSLPTVEVNLLGAMAWLGQAAQFFEQMGRGHLVGISSVAGDRGRTVNPPYHAAKAGLSAYVESLRNRLTRKGVHVLTVKPGYIQTEMLADVNARLKPITPEKAAEQITRAIRRRKQVLYTPWWWRWIMLVVEHLPSFIFRRMSF